MTCSGQTSSIHRKGDLSRPWTEPDPSQFKEEHMNPAGRQEDDLATAGASNKCGSSHWGWEPTAGQFVEVRRPGHNVRRGVIEAVIRDGSGFWLAADGVEPRAFFILADKELSIRPAPATDPDDRSRGTAS